MAALTRTEKRVRDEVEDIASSVQLDIWNIEQYAPGPHRVFLLRSMKNRIIRSEVVIKYAIIDEFLTEIICNYYFHRPDKNGTYRQLWKTKRFRVFVHFLMDETFLLKKLAMVEAITTVPKQVSNAVKRINDARNALAHSLFPENRRRYMKEKKVMYNQADLFSRGGIDEFRRDYEIARKYFHKKVFG
jgi:hypothetical protein